MKHKTTILVLAFLMLIGIASATIIPPDDYDYKGVFSIWNVKELNATGNISANKFVLGPYSYINYDASNLYSKKSIGIVSNQSVDVYLNSSGSFIIYDADDDTFPGGFPLFAFSVENNEIWTQAHGTSAHWEAAYLWGNHANAGYLLATGTLNRSKVINNWAACPSGSAQISDNETGRYCDSSFINSTDIAAYALVTTVNTVNTTAINALPQSGGTMTGNITMSAGTCINFSNGASICGV